MPELYQNGLQIAGRWSLSGLKKRFFAAFSAFNDYGMLHGIGYGYGSITNVVVNERTCLGLPAFYAAVHLLAQDLARSVVGVRELREGYMLEPAQDHPFKQFIDDGFGNDWSLYEAIEQQWMHILLYGNYYAHIKRNRAGDIIEWEVLDPARTIVYKYRGQVIYENIGNFDIAQGFNRRLFPPEEIFHIKGSSINGIQGYSPIALNRDTFGYLLAIERYGMHYFANDATPSGVVVSEQPLTPAQEENVRQQWQNAYGRTNVRGVAVLSGGVSYVPISSPPQESQMVDSRLQGIRDIGRLMNVPTTKLKDLEFATYSNVTQEAIDYVNSSLKARETRMVAAYDHQILGTRMGKEYGIVFDFGSILSGDRLQRMQAHFLARRASIFTINELRALEGYPPIEGGDQLLIETLQGSPDSSATGMNPGTTPAGGSGAGVKSQKGNPTDEGDIERFFDYDERRELAFSGMDFSFLGEEAFRGLDGLDQDAIRRISAIRRDQMAADGILT